MIPQPNIYYLSDLHEEVTRSMPKASSSFDLRVFDDEQNILIVAGDLDTKLAGVRKLQNECKKCQVIYVFGNHEYYGAKIQSLMPKAQEMIKTTPNIHILDNAAIVKSGIKFIGSTYWTYLEKNAAGIQANIRDFDSIRVLPNYRTITPAHMRKYHQEAKDFLRAEMRRTPIEQRVVVITHHAPSLQAVYADNLQLECAFGSNEDSFVERLCPDAWIHAHIHQSANYMIGQTPVLVNPRGYPVEGQLNKNFVDKCLLTLPEKSLRSSLKPSISSKKAR